MDRGAAFSLCILLGVLPAACAGPGATTETTTSRPVTSVSTTTTKPAPTISGFLAQSVSFVTDDDGFVLGVVPCSEGTCLALRHTIDGGVHWTSLSPPPTTLERGGPTGVSELHFADALDGWAIGGSVWATHDGGGSWHAIDIGGQVVAFASGAGVAYALVEPCASAPCLAPGRLYRSAVGEDMWKAVPDVSGRFDAGPSALVVEGRTVFVLETDPDPEILGSSDGVHFAPLTIPCVPEAEESLPIGPASLAASDPADLTVACLGGVAAGSQLKEAFVSHDGGHVYLRLPDPPFVGDGAQLAMPTPTTVLLGATSGATFVNRISPPQTAWTTPVDFGDGGLGLTDLAFVDPSHGAFIHADASSALGFLGQAPSPPPDLGTLYLTDDGGAEWHPVPIPR
jgi:hypothetical protein